VNAVKAIPITVLDGESKAEVEERHMAKYASEGQPKEVVKSVEELTQSTSHEKGVEEPSDDLAKSYTEEEATAKEKEEELERKQAEKDAQMKAEKVLELQRIEKEQKENESKLAFEVAEKEKADKLPKEIHEKEVTPTKAAQSMFF
jgi:hypothetical protein